MIVAASMVILAKAGTSTSAFQCAGETPAFAGVTINWMFKL